MRVSRWSGATVWLAVLVILCCLCMATCRAHGQCVGGVCPVPGLRAAQNPGWSPAAPNRLRAAWRYARPEKHLAAVCRIRAYDHAGQPSIGSGVLVRYRGQLVVLTARHVVRGAARIVVWLATGKTHPARQLAYDGTWDCAVLKIGEVEGVTPAEMVFGDEAMQKPDSRLESCGYGGDGKLAVNSGLFLGYRRSPRTNGGPTDWMAISGRARGGDSGGPIFDSAGRVAGILWGTNGTEVVGTQVGRLQLVLNRAIEQSPAQSQVASSQLAPVPRQTPTESRLLPICRPRETPAPQVIVQSDPNVGRALQSIEFKLERIVSNTTPPARPIEPAKQANDVSPLGAGLVRRGLRDVCRGRLLGPNLEGQGDRRGRP